MFEKTLESHLDCKEIKPVNFKGNQPLNIHWKDWCWSWSSNTLAIRCEELTHYKRPWGWEKLRAGGEGGDRGWMVGWHHWLNGHDFSDLQETVKVRVARRAAVHGVPRMDMTEQLENTNNRLHDAEKRVLLSHLMTPVTPNVLFTCTYHLEVQAPWELLNLITKARYL